VKDTLNKALNKILHEGNKMKINNITIINLCKKIFAVKNKKTNLG